MQVSVSESVTPFQPQIGRSVSIDRAAQLLAVSRRTIYYWIHDGRLETVRTLGGSLRVVRGSLDRMCQSRY